MTDHQVTLLAGALSTIGPMLVVLVGILLNNRQIDGVHRQIDLIREEMRETRQDIREIRTDLKTIVAKLGSMDVELAKLMDGRR